MSFFAGNVAFRKTTYASGVYRGMSTGRAVDGNTNTILQRGSCFHSSGSSRARAWWMVDLESLHVLQSVTIYNRKAVHNRLSDFSIWVSNHSNARTMRGWKICSYHRGTFTGSKTLQCMKAGRFVQIKNGGRVRGYQHYALCEVVVMGYKAIGEDKMHKKLIHFFEFHKYSRS